MPAFKSDTSFLEKISMGATGTLKVLSDLTARGHQPIELERFSTNFKIWKNIKIKRIRVPDVLCLACAHRVESRAKASFEISMSHSLADPERGWDAGLHDQDFVAIVVCEKSGDRPIDWRALDPVQYVPIDALRGAYTSGAADIQKPKGAGEGFELRIVWPSATASFAGTVTEIAEHRIQYRRATDDRTISTSLKRKDLRMKPLVRSGEPVKPHQALASIVPVVPSFECLPRVTEADYVRTLSSPSLSDRYAASKALSHFSSPGARRALAEKLADELEHPFVRFECAAGLARSDEEAGWEFIEARLADEYMPYRLEAVIILAEIPGERSSHLLSNVIRNRSQHSEIRAGAAWALGEMNNRDGLSVLIDSFAETDDLLRVEAARALAKLATEFSDDVIEAFSRVSPEQRPGVAWALSQAATFEVPHLLHALVDEDTRHWISYIVGTQQQVRVIGHIEELRRVDSEVYFAVTVLWKIMTSWVYGLESYG